MNTPNNKTDKTDKLEGIFKKIVESKVIEDAVKSLLAPFLESVKENTQKIEASDTWRKDFDRRIEQIEKREPTSQNLDVDRLEGIEEYIKKILHYNPKTGGNINIEQRKKKN